LCDILELMGSRTKKVAKKNQSQHLVPLVIATALLLVILIQTASSGRVVAWFGSPSASSIESQYVGVLFSESGVVVESTQPSVPVGLDLGGNQAVLDDVDLVSNSTDLQIEMAELDARLAKLGVVAQTEESTDSELDDTSDDTANQVDSDISSSSKHSPISNWWGDWFSRIF